MPNLNSPEAYNTVGTFSAEVPVFKPMKKDGTKKPSGKGDFAINSSMIKEVKIYESIDQYVIYGMVKFTDTGVVRISTLFREGYDYLEMSFYSNIEKEEKIVQLEILNIEGKEFGRLVQAYDEITIYFAQYPAYRNLLTWKVSKGYNDKFISEIVEDMFNTFLNPTQCFYKISNEKGPTIQKTKGKLKSFCIPFWCPHKTLNYLRRFAVADSDGEAGYFCYFDIGNHFNFRSLKHIMNNGKEHKLDLANVRNSTGQQAINDSENLVKDYYCNLANKQFYKIGLSGASIERFNWYKKKEYTHKQGYLERPLPEGPNELFEIKKDLNNMYGFHMTTGYRWSGDAGEDKIFADAMVYNQMLTSISSQCQTELVINGIPSLKSGDQIVITNFLGGANENIEELKGKWFVRSVSHWWYMETPYRQKLHLSRVGKFEHLGP